MAIMLLTCPRCRHNVELGPGPICKCPNCGHRFPIPQPLSAGVVSATTAQRTVAPGSTGKASRPPTKEIVRPTRGATIAAFVFGLLVFVPFLTQALAVTMGAFALLRPKKPNERRALAWIGLVLGMVAAPVWVWVFMRLLAPGAPMTVAVGPMPGSVAWSASTAPDGQEVQSLGDEMERIHRAAKAYYRDFRHWPSSVRPLVGRYLPHDTVLPASLTIRPVPPDKALDVTWIFMVSKPMTHDLDGRKLSRPKCLALQLSGIVEMIGEDEANDLLERYGQ